MTPLHALSLGNFLFYFFFHFYVLVQLTGFMTQMKVQITLTVCLYALVSFIFAFTIQQDVVVVYNHKTCAQLPCNITSRPTIPFLSLHNHRANGVLTYLLEQRQGAK